MSLRLRFRDRLGRFELDAAFEAPARGVTALFGPSGCGKTTVLRCLAGLHRAREGVCDIDGEIWQDAHSFRPTHLREIGFVFQEASLFPHVSVRKNLLYGAPRADADHARRFAEVVELLGLSALLDRAPGRLSGGERQRVAIGRALLSRPKLLLMDEPLSALDRLTKDEILPFLERLHQTLALPIFYVSHDMGEIERLADHLVLMEAGRVVAAGPLAQLQADPALPLIAAHEAAASLDATVESYDPAYGTATFRVAGATFRAPAPSAPEGRRRLRVYASDVSLARVFPSQSTIDNILPARILGVRETGPHQMTAVLGLGEDGAGARLLARVSQRSWELLELAPGLSVYAQVKAVALLR